MRHVRCVTLAAIAIIGLASPVCAADPPTEAPAPGAPAAAWTGFYIGADVGGAWTSNVFNWNPLPSPSLFGSNPISGVSSNAFSALAGLYGGYSWQFAPSWVVGLEGDWSYTQASNSLRQPWTAQFVGTPGAGQFTYMSQTLDWMTSLRIRLGYLIMPSLLAYGTGGVEWAHMNYAAYNRNNPAMNLLYVTNVWGSTLQAGYTVGGGLEWAMTNNWHLRGEYFYSFFQGGPSVVVQDETGDFPGFPSSYAWGSTSLSVARLGLSYRF